MEKKKTKYTERNGRNKKVRRIQQKKRKEHTSTGMR